MAGHAIRIEGLGKSYLIGRGAPRAEPYRSLREVLARNAGTVLRRTRDALRGRAVIEGEALEEYWALRDVSVDLPQGTRLGVIGRNGAGKSTLLKILSRITEPTTGRVTVHGRIASLLEVGTGFHPELTGRENIFLNGAILGMRRREIRERFDEIVAFAEIDRFLDTPVKRYSSGMYVRLAFAVAAHLDPEILIVDEVLAVGDASFQKKCLGKMRSVSEAEGKTVIFVSHSLPAISSLTSHCLLLERGRVRSTGPTAGVIADYVRDHADSGVSYRAADAPDRPGRSRVREVHLHTSSGAGTHELGEPLVVEAVVALDEARRGRTLSFQLVNQNGVAVLHVWRYDADAPWLRQAGTCRVRCTIPRLRLNVGTYALTCHLGGMPWEPQDETLEGICTFTVEATTVDTLFGWRENVCTYLEDANWREDAAWAGDAAEGGA
jgi:lipopolysaccharide transport system ATP-binding protein